MTLDGRHTIDIIEIMENFIDQIRPPEHIRLQLDINYVIDGQSVIINEVRPQFNKKEVFHEYPVAKATYIRTKNSWKIFWRRSDRKWHSYQAQPIVRDLETFTRVVFEDEHHCFWG